MCIFFSQKYRIALDSTQRFIFEVSWIGSNPKKLNKWSSQLPALIWRLPQTLNSTVRSPDTTAPNTPIKTPPKNGAHHIFFIFSDCRKLSIVKWPPQQILMAQKAIPEVRRLNLSQSVIQKLGFPMVSKANDLFNLFHVSKWRCM